MSLFRRLKRISRTHLLGSAGRAAVAALLLAAGLSQPAAAPILAAPQSGCGVVINTTDNAVGSLRWTVGCVAAGTTVTFLSGLAGQTITLTTGEIAIAQSIAIDGSGAPGIIVDAGNTSRVFNISASGPVTLTALTLQHGNTASGNGGAVLAGANSPLVLSQVQVLSSTAPAGNGGGLYTDGTLTLIGTDFISNTSVSAGGGADAQGAVLLTNGSFQGNKCTASGCFGGGLYTLGGLTLTGTQFINNLSLANGGGALAVGAAVLLTNGLFQGNHCTDTSCGGGGLYAHATLTLTGTRFISNTSVGQGGGAWAFSTAQLTNGLFQGNQCSGTGCTGGGLYARTSLTLTDTQFISNSSISDGGGANAKGDAVLTNGSFQGNHCTDSSCLGGGLFANSTALVLRSAFSGNQSAGRGGGVGLTNTAQITLANVTLSGNLAAVSGGGLYAGGASQAGLWSATVADNQAPSGGGVLANPSATLGVTNTLLSNNGGGNCAGPIAAGTHNLEFPGNACATAGPAAGFTTADPLLAPLALNAPGATLTRALLPGSPARDHGDPASCAIAPVNNLDQRGVVRPDAGGEACDIGAYEAGPPDWLVFLALLRK